MGPQEGYLGFHLLKVNGVVLHTRCGPREDYRGFHLVYVYRVVWCCTPGVDLKKVTQVLSGVDV